MKIGFWHQTPDLQSGLDELLRKSGLTNIQKRWLESVETKIHKCELPYLKTNPTHYLQVGLSAMESIQNSVTEYRGKTPHSILDFPSGFGRITRFLRVAFPQADIECAEINKSALRFCKRTFGTDSTQSENDFSKLRLKRNYDLIWCGSLITHLSYERSKTLLSCFYQHLNPGGLCLFTTHGERVEEILKNEELTYSLSQTSIRNLIQDCDKTGYAFTEYEPPRTGYGLSLSKDATIRKIANSVGRWDLKRFKSAGWDNHQDVYTYQK